MNGCTCSIPNDYEAVICDKRSSILKNFDGVREKAIVTEFLRTKKNTDFFARPLLPRTITLNLEQPRRHLVNFGFMDMLNPFFQER